MRFEYQNAQVLLRAKRIDVLSVEVQHPRGGVIRREVVDHPGAVVILPLLDNETILMIRNERFAVQKTLWELPAGTLEKDEEPIVCAARELEEETGYHAQTITPLLHFFATPGICNELLFSFVAEGLKFVGQNLDETEQIDVLPIRIHELLKMIKEGTICDAKTICTLLYFHTYCYGKQQSE